uniref:Small EDRK-rich factor-like N-terminal domain-containing protein n=1 Tax=Sinocyclocheilus rhinocerous TaxID=307959 RepID=A0A673G1B4_9TELE
MRTTEAIKQAQTLTRYRELAGQKSAKKQSDAQKGKENDGLSAAARKQRDAEIMQQKQKKTNEKMESKVK